MWNLRLPARGRAGRPGAPRRGRRPAPPSVRPARPRPRAATAARLVLPGVGPQQGKVRPAGRARCGGVAEAHHVGLQPAGRRHRPRPHAPRLPRGSEGKKGTPRPPSSPAPGHRPLEGDPVGERQDCPAPAGRRPRGAAISTGARADTSHRVMVLLHCGAPSPGRPAAGVLHAAWPPGATIRPRGEPAPSRSRSRASFLRRAMRQVAGVPQHVHPPARPRRWGRPGPPRTVRACSMGSTPPARPAVPRVVRGADEGLPLEGALALGVSGGASVAGGWRSDVATRRPVASGRAPAWCRSSARGEGVRG